MKTKRKLVVGVTALALAALMLIGMTMAYLTDQRATLNVLGIGTGSDQNTPTVKIKLTEPGFAGTDGVTKTVVNKGEADEYSKVELYNILPGVGVNKDPTITNIGAEAAYIRVKLVEKVPVKNAEGEITGYTDRALDLSALPFEGVEVTSAWTKVGDYYYLTNVLATEGVAKLFVEKTDTDGNAYTMMIPASKSNTDLQDMLGVLNMEVVAEAIQSRGFTPDLTADEPWSVEGDGTTAVTIIPAIRG